MSSLKGKVAAVFAASGAIAGAVAQSFARHGAKVYVSGRDMKKVGALAGDIRHWGGMATAVRVDAMDEKEIDGFLKRVVEENGRLDIVFNGIGIPGHEYGTNTPATEMTFAQFVRGFEALCGSQFLTSGAAARYMIESGSQGTILTLTAALSRGKYPNTAGYTTASTAIEGLTRSLAAELGKYGIKVICLNATALPETERIRDSFEKYAKMAGVSAEDIAAGVAQQNILSSGITLSHVAETATFLVSDTGMGFNSHIVDVDGGRFTVI